ncbi:MAG TPA: DUF3325 family protein [Hyphomicrobiales bacterium]|nr:DUF3325 family protein [Hyphomicrobiales bacterium]
MLFLAGYGFAFVGIVLLALRRPRHALAIWPQAKPMPPHWSLAAAAALAFGLALSCMWAVADHDAAMAAIATLCLIVLAAIGMTLLLGFWPRHVLSAAKLGIALALLSVALHLGSAS